jgi:cleavage and polyadenylation specificity factor subunit 1
MQCYSELVPPTAVACSISLPFLSSTANNLIVAKSSLIQIFALKSVLADEQPSQGELQTPRGSRKERSYIAKLVLIGQYQLSGTITGLGRVKPLRSKSGGELLVVAIKDAKLSLVQWDPEKYSISTVSIHYYEREDLQGSPWAPQLSQCVTHLTVDPGNRCAAYKFGTRHLAILPFHQKGDDLAIDDFDQESDLQPVQRRSSSLRDNDEADGNETPYAASFVLSLLTLDPTLIHPVHLAFLYGYREPTLGILSSQTAPSSSLLPERRDPMSFTVYTLDLEQKASTSLLSITGLPYDISKFVPLPTPIGGALLIGSNEIIHIDQSGKANGVAVNEFAAESTDFPLVSQSDLCLKLEGCVVEQLSGSHGQMLLVLSNGHLVLLSFQTDGRAVSAISLEPIPSQNGRELLQHSLSCTAVIGRGRLFLGSEDADSVVLGWSLPASSKRQRAKDEVADELGLDDDLGTDTEDENDLYADVSTIHNRKSQGKAAGANAAASEYHFRIHDSLHNLSPLRGLRAIQSCFPDASPNSSNMDLVAITGNGKYGSLTRLRPELSLGKSAKLGSNASRVWTFHANHSNSGKSTAAEVTNTVLIRQKDGQSRVYKFSGNELHELTETDFEPDTGATIEVATLSTSSRILQVLPTELRAYDGGKLFLYPSLRIPYVGTTCAYQHVRRKWKRNTVPHMVGGLYTICPDSDQIHTAYLSAVSRITFCRLCR